jgi:hypothetical protein
MSLTSMLRFGKMKRRAVAWARRDALSRFDLSAPPVKRSKQNKYSKPGWSCQSPFPRKNECGSNILAL